MLQSTVLDKLANLSRKLRNRIASPGTFRSSGEYWDQRYRHGGDSGDGSYGKLALFKAETLNQFVANHSVADVIEFGCGDGNQLAMADYPKYIGFDVSPEALRICRSKFADDSCKSFKEMKDFNNESSELTLSLDVIFHLIEDAVFDDYMHLLFLSSRKYVAIYSSNSNENSTQAPHFKNRIFSDWISTNASEWTLKKEVRNPYPYNEHTGKGSMSDFYFYEKSV